MRNHTLFILCGGKGTRLKKISGPTPKPLVEFFSIPFLEYQIENWCKFGFKKFHFLICYKPNLFLIFLNNFFSNRNDISYSYSIEERPLGTGGAIKAALVDNVSVNEFCTVVNADTYTTFDFFDFNNKSCNLIAVVQSHEYKRYGQVVMEDNNIITSFLEKNDVRVRKVNNKSLISAGVYRLRVSRLTEYSSDRFSLETDFLPDLLGKETIKGVEYDGRIIDIGTPESFERFLDFVK